MSSHRRSNSRSRSPDRRDQQRTQDLPHGAESISESDYFLKSSEFRVWLKDEKDRYFDELSGEKARSYFRKFVKAWNRGKLPKALYAGVDVAAQAAAAQTGYKWTFAAKRPRADHDAIAEARNAVIAATHATPLDAPYAASSSAPAGPRRVHGPTLPSHSDLVLARETDAERAVAERAGKRRRERDEVRERVEELVGPKETGREGMLEKKRMKREEGRAVRDAKDDVFGEVDESTLMGGGDSFKARIAQRDAAKRRFEEKKAASRGEKLSDTRERAEAIRAKDKATMDMFKQMAKERFGA